MAPFKSTLVLGLVLGLAVLSALPALAAIDVNNSFTPSTRYPGEPARLIIRLQNSSLSPSQDVALENTLPAGVYLAPDANIANNCGGTLTASNDAERGSVSIVSAQIPAGDGSNTGSCQIELDVIGQERGTYVSTIAAGALTGITNGVPEANAMASSATLAIIAQDVELSWATTYTEGVRTGAAVTLQGNETFSRHIVIYNPNPVALTGAGFNYDLWAGSYNVRIREDLPMGSTCGGTLAVAVRPARTATFGPTSQLTFAGGVLPAQSSCEVFFAVEPSREATLSFNQTTLTHSLAANVISTDQGATNISAASNNVGTQTGIRVIKRFNGGSTATVNINTTSSAQLRLIFQNLNVQPVTGIDFTDFMPTGLTVVSADQNTCAGSVSFAPVSELTLSGATLPGGAANQPGQQTGSCEVAVTVTVAAEGAYLNQIPAGMLGGTHQFGATSATLNVTNPAPPPALNISMLLSRSGTLYAGDTLNASFTLTNDASGAPVANVRIPADLATLGYGFRVGPSGLISNTCGGSITALPDATSFQTGGLAVNPGESCSFTVQLITAADAVLTAGTSENRTLTIAAGAILHDTPDTQDIPNSLAVTASIGLQPAVSLSMSFSPAVVGPLGISRLRINIQRRSSDLVGMRDISVISTLPAGHVVAPVPDVLNGCGGSVSAAPGSSTVALSGASITLAAGAALTCSLEVNIRAAGLVAPATTATAAASIAADPRPGARVNFIATDNRQPAGFNEVRNLRAASANLTRLASDVTVSKAFSPTFINGGGVSRVRITLSNLASTALNLTGLSITDAFSDTDMRLYADVNPTFTDLAGNPNANGCSGGTFTGASGDAQITLAGAAILAGRSCLFEFNITAFGGGNKINRIPPGALATLEGISNPSEVSATLTVGYQIGVGTGFAPSVMEAGSQSTLSLEFYNTNLVPNDQTGASPAIVDIMPPGLQIVPATATTDCAGGVVSYGVDGSGNHFLRLDGGVFPASGVCRVQAQVTGSATGVYLNEIPAGALRALSGLTNINAAQAQLRIIQPPVITKAFGPASIPLGGTSVITFTLQNPNPAEVLPAGMTGIAFTDTMENMQVAAPLSIGGTCAGVATNAQIGATAFSISNISLAAGAQCTVTLPVTSSTPGLLPNQASGAISGQTSQPGPASNIAELRVLEPVTLAKSFAVTEIFSGQTARLVFELINPNPVAASISNPGFTDTFPTSPGVMAVAPVPNLSSTCTGAAIRNLGDSANLAAGNLGVLVRGGTVPASAGCQISFDITAQQPGLYLNTTSGIQSAGGSAPAGAAELLVLSVSATDDTATGINGLPGAQSVLNVFDGDVLNNAPATAATTLLSLAAGSAVPAELTFDLATGAVGVVPGARQATYSFRYRICDRTIALNCAEANASVSVAPSADLSITKTNTPGINNDADPADDGVISGTVTNYTIIVRNNGPDSATGAVVKDTVVSGLICPATNPVSLSGAGVPGGSFTFADLSGAGITLGTLSAGQAATLSFSCSVN